MTDEFTSALKEPVNDREALQALEYRRAMFNAMPTRGKPVNTPWVERPRSPTTLELIRGSRITQATGAATSGEPVQTTSAIESDAERLKRAAAVLEALSRSPADWQAQMEGCHALREILIRQTEDEWLDFPLARQLASLGVLAVLAGTLQTHISTRCVLEQGLAALAELCIDDSVRDKAMAEGLDEVTLACLRAFPAFSGVQQYGMTVLSLLSRRVAFARLISAKGAGPLARQAVSVLGDRFPAVKETATIVSEQCQRVDVYDSPDHREARQRRALPHLGEGYLPLKDLKDGTLRNGV